MTDATVQLTNISRHFGALRAVEGVDLALHPGERVALVGHNGAGKSTLIKIMLGLLRPSGGAVRVLGGDPAGPAASDIRRGIGFLPESVVFHPAMTGAELMEFYARLKRQPVSRNAALLERVGIAHAARRRVGTYSKGMRQRLGLAQALIGRPRLLLLDEPTTGLDPASRQDVYAILAELSRDGASVLLSSHALAEIEHQADRVIGLARGRKIADGSLAELRRMSARPTRILLHLAQPVTPHPALFGERVVWRQAGPACIEITCTEAEKLETLRLACASALPVRDVEIAAPTLDDIYAGFLRQEAAE